MNCIQCNNNLYTGSKFCSKNCEVDYKLSKMENLTNREFGNWSVISLVKIKKCGNFWLCRCKCGTEKLQRAANLNSGITKQCVRCANESRKNKDIFPLYILSKIKNSALKRNIAFNLSKNELENLIVKQDFKCAYTKLPIMFAKSVKEHGHSGSTASLDRINSNICYEIGNVQWVHKDVNLMKNKLSQPRFLELCKLITEGCLNAKSPF